MRKIATTTNYGLYLNDDDTETFLSWRNKLNGDTGTSNMNIIDDALNDHDTAIESVKSDLSEHTDDTTVHLTSSEHTSLTTHLADTDIHVTAEDKETWSSGGFSWNLAYDTKSMESWSRSSTTNLTLEEDDDGFNVATYSSSGSTTGRYIRGGFIPYEDIAGVECTVSVMARSDDAESMVTDGGGLRIILQVNEPDVIGTSLATKTFDLTGEGMTTEWVKYSQTFTYSTSAATDTCEVNFRLNNYSYYTMEVKQLKVEYGDTATEWTPHISEYSSDGAAATADTLTTARTLTVDLTGESADTFDGSSDVSIGISGILPIANGGTGNNTGTAAYATQLETARTIRTSLGSTSSASFNGTANITPGVTGTLSYSHGGTSATTYANAVYNLINGATEITSPTTTDYFGLLDSANTTGGKLSMANLTTYLESTLNISSSGTIDLSENATGILPVENGGTGNSAGTATGLTTAVDLSIDLSTAGTVSFDGTTATAIPVSSSSGALPLAYGGTGGTSQDSAAISLLYRGTSSGYASGYYIPIITSANFRNMRTSKLLNSMLLEATEVDSTTLNDYSSYYFPFAASQSGDTYDSVTYKITPSSLLIWMDDNISVDLANNVSGTLSTDNGGTGNTTGTATYATQLETGRTIQTNLSSTSAVTFDGTSNITPGITGTLPAGYGGTGATSAADALYNLINGGSTLTTLATSDYLGVLDYSATTGGKITISNLLTYLSSNINSSNSNIVVGTYTGEYDVETTTSTVIFSTDTDQAAFAMVGALDNYDNRSATIMPWQYYIDADDYAQTATYFAYTLYDGTDDYDWDGRNAASGSGTALYFYHPSSGGMSLRARNRYYETSAGATYETALTLENITYFYIIIYL